MKSLAKTTAMIAPMTMPGDLVAELDRAVGAEPPAGGAVLLHVAGALVETSSTVPAIRPTAGSWRPIAARRTTVTTKADEIGF